jgi:hypothetical protein
VIPRRRHYRHDARGLSCEPRPRACRSTQPSATACAGWCRLSVCGLGIVFRESEWKMPDLIQHERSKEVRAWLRRRLRSSRLIQEDRARDERQDLEQRDKWIDGFLNIQNRATTSTSAYCAGSSRRSRSDPGASSRSYSDLRCVAPGRLHMARPHIDRSWTARSVQEDDPARFRRACITRC